MAEKLPPSPSSASPGNIVAIDPEKLTLDQNKDFEAMMQQAREQFFRSFTQTHKGTFVQKYKVKVVPDEPKTSTSKEGEEKRVLDGSAQENQGDGSQGVHAVQGDGAHEPQRGNLNQNGETAQDFFNNFQDRVDYAVHNALINQSGVLVNTLSNMMKTIADGSIAEHQAAGPVYLQGGVFPNYRPLITDVQLPAQAVLPSAPSAQPMAPPLTSLPAPSASTPGQPINPRLLMREQPQHSGQTQQSQGAAQQRPWADVIADVMREQFRLKPRDTGKLYRQPYPEWFEKVPLPNRFKIPDFSKFLGQDGVVEARRSSKRVNHVCPYVYGSDDDNDDSEIAAAEWVRSQKVIPCQWVKNSGKEEKYDFDITKADKIFDLLLREKQIQLPAGHVNPSAEELGKRRYCKWHNSGSHSTNDCKVFRQQIQVAIERGKIKFDDSKKPMKVDERHYEEDNDGFNPHWSCEFFRFCWNEGMRLPSIEDCPGCSDITESSSRSYKRGNRLKQARIPVHQRLGPVNQDDYLEEDENAKTQWCPSGIFTKNQKRRVQRLRSKERFQEVEQEIGHRLRKAKPRKEWRVKNQVLGADDIAADKAKRLANGKSVVTALINMVFTLPAEFGIDQADVDELEEGSAKLVLSPERAVFEKPEGTENRHLKPLYINGYVNGKPMSKMMVDGGAAVNLMPYTTFRKLGRTTEDLIKTNMVLKDFGGNPSETKGVLNVELTVGSKTIPTTFFVIDGKGSYSLLLIRDWIHANCCIPSTIHQCLIQWQGDKVEIVPADSRLKMKNPSYYFEGVVEGSSVYAKDTVDDLDDKQGQGFMPADDLEEVDIGPGDRPRPTFISKNLSSEFRTKLIELLKEFRDCFAWEYYEMPGLNRSIVEHRLPLKPGIIPHQQPPRRCKADMLEPVKKNGKVRVCIDFRDLNKATPKDEHPMPVADQLVDAASGHKILSFMDGNAGYNQIFMAEEDIHKTAFRCPGAIGLFEWVVTTFGLKSAGATYQRAMNYIYHDLIGWLVEVYIDDVVVKSREIEDHIADLRKVFERTRKYGLKMNPTKCAFGVSAGQFLGFLVHERGIEIPQRSINAIKKIKPPRNKTELQEMIGKINFVRRFISNLSGKLEPFTPLLRLRADQQFTWGAEQQKALDNIKEYLSSPPVLIPPQKGIPFRLYLSAGDKSIGSVLIQELEGKERVVFYLSRRLLDAETRTLISEFRLVTLKHISREQNIEANYLAQGASGYKPMTKDIEIEIATITADDWRYYKGCQDCQKFGAIQRAPASAMNPIIKPWPFRGWGIDMIANGQAEASNKSLIKLIKRKISDYPRQWHTRLAEALWSYRMSCHGSIQVPPYELVYGHEAVLPWEVRIGSRRTELQNTLTADEYYNLMADEREDLVQSRLRALAKVTRDKERVARHYNKKVVPKDFSEGELVWKLILLIGTRDSKFGKWSPNWERPFQIHKVVSKGAYMLHGLDGEVYGRALNGKYLKKYYPSVWVNA
uniref:Ty3-gypsy sub-class retrotransposonable element polyprotein n=1 Tax=Oryza sativa subsp. japonica TaxID=39947 RepID=A0A411DB74_ORYSJ|nr:ty3-gypsy sub-class retrotransposonable element polyprotein [Oryza sativa Japonica Group]